MSKNQMLKNQMGKQWKLLLVGFSMLACVLAWNTSCDTKPGDDEEVTSTTEVAHEHTTADTSDAGHAEQPVQEAAAEVVPEPTQEAVVPEETKETGAPETTTDVKVVACQKDTDCAPTSCAVLPQNGGCSQNAPRCNAGTCERDEKLVKFTCTQKGNDCVQTIPSCNKNLCEQATQTLLNDVCDNTSGLCRTTKNSCEKNQGMCVASGVTCPGERVATKGLTCTISENTCCVLN